MAENGSLITAVDKPVATDARNRAAARRRLNEIIYAQPAPIKTFPLPSFYPNNPVSLFHIAYQWLSHALFPPKEAIVIHQGIWSPGTNSVHIVEHASIRALWEQGFYGKGHLSRSEPEWFKLQQIRRGVVEGKVSHLITNARRDERGEMKWERARTQQEAIWQQREAEGIGKIAKEGNGETANVTAPSPPRPNPLAALLAPPTPSLAPVGPLELLALPNSKADLPATPTINGHLSKPNGTPTSNGHATTPKTTPNGVLNGIVKSRDRSTTASSEASDESPSPIKRRKSVRFSPKVESTTFMLSDPPSPGHALAMKDADKLPGGTATPTDAKEGKVAATGVSGDTISAADEETPLVDIERLQLVPEEALFLAFGLGVLKVTHPETKKELTIIEMFDLFRRFSYFPPRIDTTSSELSLTPDDPFLVQYAVYHHFRSLGWTPRPGIKFGVDWLLYQRGPVFDHAHFAIMVLPSYTDPMWKYIEKQGAREVSWYSFHGTMRVVTHAKKHLVVVYVDVPPPAVFDEALERGVTAVLGAYKVREFPIARWSANRNR